MSKHRKDPNCPVCNPELTKNSTKFGIRHLIAPMPRLCAAHRGKK